MPVTLALTRLTDADRERDSDAVLEPLLVEVREADAVMLALTLSLGKTELVRVTGTLALAENDGEGVGDGIGAHAVRMTAPPAPPAVEPPANETAPNVAQLALT